MAVIMVVEETKVRLEMNVRITVCRGSLLRTSKTKTGHGYESYDEHKNEIILSPTVE